jgi:hypothetical protein
MTAVIIEKSGGLDRLATYAEVLCAMSSSSQNDLELVSVCDDFRELNSDLDSRVRNVPENDMWLAIAGETPVATIN